MVVMGIEKEVKRRNRKANLQKIILGTIKLGGVLAIGMLAPNVLGAMGKLGLVPHQRQKESIISSRKNLVQKGLLKYKNGNLEITEKGRGILEKEIILDRSRGKKRKWDGKWRVLIFDIPEGRKKDRERVRYVLISLGFMRLQDSVWIYPYDCEEIITLLKADLRVGKDVLYMVVEALEYDKPVKSYFGLQ